MKFEKENRKKHLRDYLGTTQLQLQNFSVQEHKVDIRQTDTQTTDRQKPIFLLHFLSPGVKNDKKKSFSSIGRKLIFETVTIYVLRDSGHTIKKKTYKFNQTDFSLKYQPPK